MLDHSDLLRQRLTAVALAAFLEDQCQVAVGQLALCRFNDIGHRVSILLARKARQDAAFYLIGTRIQRNGCRGHRQDVHVFAEIHNDAVVRKQCSGDLRLTQADSIDVDIVLERGNVHPVGLVGLIALHLELDAPLALRNIPCVFAVLVGIQRVLLVEVIRIPFDLLARFGILIIDGQLCASQSVGGHCLKDVAARINQPFELSAAAVCLDPFGKILVPDIQQLAACIRYDHAADKCADHAAERAAQCCTDRQTCLCTKVSAEPGNAHSQCVQTGRLNLEAGVSAGIEHLLAIVDSARCGVDDVHRGADCLEACAELTAVKVGHCTLPVLGHIVPAEGEAVVQEQVACARCDGGEAIDFGVFIDFTDLPADLDQIAAHAL